MKLYIKKLVWNSWNVEHIKKHSLVPADVENALSDAKIRFTHGHSERILVLARSGNRLIAMVLAQEQLNTYYVVTARDMDKKERNIYRKEN